MSPVVHPLHKFRLVHHWRLGMALVLLSHHAVPRSPTTSTAQRFAADIDALSTLLNWFIACITITRSTANAQIPIAT